MFVGAVSSAITPRFVRPAAASPAADLSTPPRPPSQPVGRTQGDTVRLSGAGKDALEGFRRDGGEARQQAARVNRQATYDARGLAQAAAASGASFSVAA